MVTLLCYLQQVKQVEVHRNDPPVTTARVVVRG